MTEELTKDLIKRPDGTYIRYEDAKPRDQLAHDLVAAMFPDAERLSTKLERLKKEVLVELDAYRDLLLSDFGVRVTGKKGGFSVKTLCGSMMIELEVADLISVRPEIMAAKAILDEFFEERLAGSDEMIKDIVEKAFRINKKGMMNTQRVLELTRDHNFDHPLWHKAMRIIKEAIDRDAKATRVRFYRRNPKTENMELVPLAITQVGAGE